MLAERGVSHGERDVPAAMAAEEQGDHRCRPRVEWWRTKMPAIAKLRCKPLAVAANGAAVSQFSGESLRQVVGTKE